MADSLENSSGVIDINSTYDMVSWAAKLGVKVADLRRLVLKHGPAVKVIRSVLSQCTESQGHFGFRI
jgi:hypothetical protein